MRDSLWHPPIIWIGLAHSEIEIMRGAGESSSDLSWLLFSIQGLRYRCWRRCWRRGLIEEENSVSARSDFGCDFIEVKLHSFGVAGRQHEGGARSAFGADCTEQVGRLGPLVVAARGREPFLAQR
jgi:hypothetical protein